MKCEICGKEAEITLSPDPDIKGLRACSIHLPDMQQLYLVLIFLGEEEYQDNLESLQKSETKKSKKRKKFVK